MPARLENGTREAGTELPGEEEFLHGANQAIQAAIKNLHRSGIATTHELDGQLVCIHPDGRREVLGPLPEL